MIDSNLFDKQGWKIATWDTLIDRRMSNTMTSNNKLTIDADTVCQSSRGCNASINWDKN